MTGSVALDPDLDAQLLRDPDGVYAACDEATRWRYREVAGALATRSGLPPAEVARRAVDRATGAAAARASSGSVASHVGYYLVGEGAQRFASELGVPRSRRERLASLLWRHAPTVFRYTAGLVTAVLLVALLSFLRSRGVAWCWTAVATVAAFPLVARHGIAVGRALVARGASFRPLPRLSTTAVAARGSVTLIVVPALLPSPARADELLDRLEQLARAHPEPGFRFALLSDFTDAFEECTHEDEAILARVRERVAALNAAPDDIGDRFFVLHRRRVWSRTQCAWISWERKRGKLLELAQLLTGDARRTTFTWVLGDLAGLRARAEVPWVITLDEESWLEPGDAIDLVRTAAHPLNRPCFDESTGRLASGYAIFQPALLFVSPAAASTGGGAAATTGRLAPRTRWPIRPQFYPDVLGVGIHRGAGALYDIVAYRRLLDGTFPPERILQHDLLDGFAARTAEVHGCFVIQALPRSYLAQLRRGHRWLRGTFQSLPWLLPTVRDGRGQWAPNPLSAIQRFFIADLALAELTKPGALVLLVCGWTVLPGSALLWTLIACPSLARALGALAAGAARRGMARLTRVGAPPTSTLARFFPVLFAQAMLAIEAVVVIDAFTRALWRMAVSRRRLLDWTTHRTLDVGGTPSLRRYWRDAWPSTALGAALAAGLALSRPASLPVAAPFAAAWIAVPWLLWAADRLVFAPDGGHAESR